MFPDATVTAAGPDVPCRPMLCVAYPGACAFRLVSVSTTLPVMPPDDTGIKSMAIVQLAPAASVKEDEAPVPACVHVEASFQAKFSDTLGL